MRQMLMLEKADLDLLRQGETLTLNVGDAAVVLGLSGVAKRGRRAQQPPPNGGPVVCPVCGAHQSTVTLCTEHIRRNHPKESNAARASKEPWVCSYCQPPTTWLTSTGYHRHVSSTHPGEVHERLYDRVRLLVSARNGKPTADKPVRRAAGVRCSYCSTVLKNTKRLRDHFRRQHAKEYAKDGPGGPLKCSKCPMRFPNTKELGAHKWMTHHIKGASR